MKKYYQLGAVNQDGTKAIEPRIVIAESAQSAINSVPENLKEIYAANNVEFSARRVSVLDVDAIADIGDHSVGNYEFYFENGSFRTFPTGFNHPEVLFFLRVTEPEFFGEKSIKREFVVYETANQVVATWKFGKWVEE